MSHIGLERFFLTKFLTFSFSNREDALMIKLVKISEGFKFYRNTNSSLELAITCELCEEGS